LVNNDLTYNFGTPDLIGDSTPLGVLSRSTLLFDGETEAPEGEGSQFTAQMSAAASDGRINILSSPHILTSDNELAEIRIGDNIPIVTSRVSSAAGATDNGLSSSVNVERKDIGVTLRVTPQISDGDTLRLEIFQEITEVNEALSLTVAGTGSSSDVGVALSNRHVENTVVVANGHTVVIGGLIQEVDNTKEAKVPFLGDIPVLGWLFKSTSSSTRRVNLIIMLTPHIIRSPDDLESESILRRSKFTDTTESTEEIERMAEAVRDGRGEVSPHSQVDEHLLDHTLRYPIERLNEIENKRTSDRIELERLREIEINGPRFMVRAALLNDDRAAQTVTEINDLGYDATLVSSLGENGIVSEVHVGPFDSLGQAESAQVVFERSMKIDPYIVELEPEEFVEPESFENSVR
jgi:hypothetical protein